MRCILALLLTLTQILIIKATVNYCGAKMCGHTNAHTFCKYRPGPSPSCTGYMEARLTKEEKERILARLNRRRSEVARGMRQWAPAGDMLKLRWIDELSREAQRWADQCRPPQTPEEHDVCRDLYSISVGQCVASIVGEAPGLRPESMVDMWYMQSLLYDGNVTSYVPPYHKHLYGDFAQMIWSKTYMVGCARSRFMADWRGRLRSVERLVCNFAPRGPIPNRPLWIPAEPASVCPPRSRPDSDVSGICAYQNFVDAQNDTNHTSLVQDNYVLDTIFEIESNNTLNYFGSLDELYLTKIAIATIDNHVVTVPTYYSVRKRDIFKKDQENGIVMDSNETENEHLINMTHNRAIFEETTATSTRLLWSKVKVIGRPKPYDINDLNEDPQEQKVENFNENGDLMIRKEKDFYIEYGLIESELGVEDTNNSTTSQETTQSMLNETSPIEANTPTIETSSEMSKATDVMDILDKIYYNKTFEEFNGTYISDKSIEDYLSDPETVRQLQEALDRMERTLASPPPVPTSGKVRRELRNFETNTEPNGKSTTTAINLKADEVSRNEERNKSKDRAPMLRMVLNYLPYLKPYEKDIIGEASSFCTASHCDLFIVGCSLLLKVFF